MKTYARGDKFDGLTLPAPEGVSVDAGPTWTIYVITQRPTASEARALETGAVELAIEREGVALVFYLRVPGLLDWSAAAWPWWSRRAPEVPSDRPGVGGLCQIVLVCAQKGTVQALRTVGLTLAVAGRLRELEREAQARGRDEAGWADVLRYTQHLSPADAERAARAAAVITGVPARRS